MVVCYMKDQVDRALLPKRLQTSFSRSDRFSDHESAEPGGGHLSIQMVQPFPSSNIPSVRIRPPLPCWRAISSCWWTIPPSAIILPTSIFDLIEQADDYYFRR